MLVRFGSIVTEGAGKVGGQIIQRGSFGQILRNLRPPIIRKQEFETKNRSNVSRVASLWRLLSASDKSSWGVLASGLTRYNKFGVAYTPSGYQIFLECNLNISFLGPSAVIETAPGSPSFPTVTGITAVTSPTGPTVTVSWSSTGGDSTFKTLVGFYPLQSLGASVPRGSSRYTGSYVATTAETIDVSAAFSNRFKTVSGGSCQVAMVLKTIDLASGFALPSTVIIQPYST